MYRPILVLYCLYTASIRGINSVRPFDGGPMTTEMFLFASGVIILSVTALLSVRLGTWYLLLAGSAIAIMGAMIGYEVSVVHPGSAGSAPPVKLGHGLIAFSGVLGGAIIGSAFSELRSRRRKA